MGLTIYLPWMEVKGLYQINNGTHILAGERADEILPKEAVVVAPNAGDTSFLYYINRPGFAFVPLPVAEMIQLYGVTHFVSTSYDAQTNELLGLYKVVEKTPEYVIIDLRERSTPDVIPMNVGI